MATQLDIRRHQELFDAERFTDKVHIIGAGATGSWLALMLAKMGIDGSQINVWDFDVIEEHNVPNQLYGIESVGVKKVVQLGIDIQAQTGTLINAKDGEFSNQRLNGYVFMMIDTMAGRKAIWEQAVKMKTAIKLYTEPRMGLDMGRIYNVEPTELAHIKQYETTFYSDEEAEVSACGTSQTVITTAMSVASYCARQLINHHAGEELDNEILLDLKYNNLIATKW